MTDKTQWQTVEHKGNCNPKKLASILYARGKTIAVTYRLVNWTNLEILLEKRRIYNNDGKYATLTDCIRHDRTISPELKSKSARCIYEVKI